MSDIERSYLELLREIMDKGHQRDTRSGVTRSLFGTQLRCDLKDGFPFLTTKKMFYRAVIEEQLFFLRGETDSKLLEEKKINIWRGNTSREFLDSRGLPYAEGDMGPMYGWQWRHYGHPYFGKNSLYRNTGYDQLRQLIRDIRDDPNSRRLLLTTYNPEQVGDSVLAPCHSLICQFYVQEGTLSVHMYQRSADAFLGLPFNIAGTTFLLKVLAHVSHLEPRQVIISLGDYHLYENHLEVANTQYKRAPLPLPELEILKEAPPVDTPSREVVRYLENLQFADFKLHNYRCHPAIKAPMSV